MEQFGSVLKKNVMIRVYKSINMKKLNYSLFFFLSLFLANGQVSIDKETVEGASVILDFNSPLTTDTYGTINENTKGIILPALDRSPVYNIPNVTASSVNNGTFIFDKELKKVRMFENNVWVDLSDDKGKIDAIIPNSSNEVGNGVIIGAENSSAEGVLVLENATKAMILPRISNPDISVKGPYPGMICYDTASKSFALYDGAFWHYWK